MVLRVLDERRDLEVLDPVGDVADVPQAHRRLHDGADDVALEGEAARDFRLGGERVFVAPLRLARRFSVLLEGEAGSTPRLNVNAFPPATDSVTEVEMCASMLRRIVPRQAPRLAAG